MEFSIDPILQAVATSRGPSASHPCTLDPLMWLIEHVMGRPSLGPSMPTLDFAVECVTVGLVLCRQHSVLGEVRFLRPGFAPAVYDRWCSMERKRLSLPDSLDIEPPSEMILSEALTLAGPIALRNLAAVRRR